MYELKAVIQEYNLETLFWKTKHVTQYNKLSVYRTHVIFHGSGCKLT
jgi:hypothetical protein